MRLQSLSLVLLGLNLGSCWTPHEASHDETFLERAKREIAAREYHASPTDSGLQAPNRAHGLRTFFEPTGIRVRDRMADTALVAVRLSSLGRGESRSAVAPGEVASQGPRVEIRRPGLVEWYVNEPRGLEQGFTLAERVSGEGELVLELGLEGALASLDQGALQLATASGRSLRYGALVARDARAHALPARLELASATQVRLVVDDRAASYPIEIDPLLTETFDGRLASEQPLSNFGQVVASAGDVNGDGRADVIVGVPLYDLGQTNEGAAWIFLGQAGTGLATGAPPSAIIQSNVIGAQIADAVASAGDLNGDGYDDVIVGMRSYQPTSDPTKHGAAMIFHGGPLGIPNGSIATAGTVITGAFTTTLGAAGWAEQFGVQVASAGDVNGDGFGDVAISANQAQGEVSDGGVWIFHGRVGGIPSSPAGSANARIVGPGSSAFGAALAAGDVNGDGFDDLVVGARGHTSGRGAVFVFHGGAAGLPTGAGQTLANAHLFGSQGALAGGFAEAFGLAVALDDENADGYADLVVAAPYWDAGVVDAGALFTFRSGGAAGISDNVTPAQRTGEYLGESTNAQLGFAMAALGDLNGDGRSDLAALDLQGHIYLFYGQAHGTPFGGSASLFAAQLLEPPAGSPIPTSIAGAGDADGDGFGDLLLGDPAAMSIDNGRDGAVFFYRGGAFGLSPRGSSVYIYSSAPSNVGSSVAFAGDVNGDGFGDVIIGAPDYDFGQSDQGAAFVYYRGESAQVVGSNTIESGLASARLGASVASAGDVNGDGYADVVVGAPGWSAPEVGEGAAFVFAGGPSGLVNGVVTPADAIGRLESNQAGALLGSRIATAGDLNEDGFDDVLVGAPAYSHGNTAEGALFILEGARFGIGSRIPLTVAGRIEGGQTGANLGHALSSAGDVDGDFRTEILAGAPGYSNGQSREGGVFVFMGSPPPGAEIGNYADTIIESNRIDGNLGAVVSNAGDVDGDGYDDIAFGWSTAFLAPARSGAFVHFGGPGGVLGGSATSTTALLAGVAADDQLGSALASSDVNGDGFADLTVGAPGTTQSQINEGVIYVFQGSPSARTDLFATADGLLAGGSPQRRFGQNLAGNGDVAGDGYGDLMVGAPLEGAQGRVFVFPGNHQERLARLHQHSGTVTGPPIAPGGFSRTRGAFTPEIFASHPGSHGRVAAQFELCGPGGCSVTTTGFAPVGAPALFASRSHAFTGLIDGARYRWRARVLYADDTGPLPPNPEHSPWLRPAAALAKFDVRMPIDRDGDGIFDPVDNCPLVSNAGQQDVGGLGNGSPPDQIGDACQCGNVTGSGRADSVDVIAYRQSLANGTPLSAAAQTRCAVYAVPDCGLLQVTVLRRALASPALLPVTTAPVAQICYAEVPPT